MAARYVSPAAVYMPPLSFIPTIAAAPSGDGRLLEYLLTLKPIVAPIILQEGPPAKMEVMPNIYTVNTDLELALRDIGDTRPIASLPAASRASNLLTPAEVKVMMALTYTERRPASGKRPILSMSTPLSREVLLEVTYLLQKDGFEATVKYLSDPHISDENILLRNLPSLESQRGIERVEAAILRGDAKVTDSGVECTKCKGTNVTYFTAETRGLDEPANIFYQCHTDTCGNRWSSAG